MIGQYMTVDEVLKEALSDQLLYSQSGGGVTLSGGEPLRQPEFALALLRELKANWVHTAIETCGHFTWKAFEDLLPYLDLVFMDLKVFNDERHSKGQKQV